MEGNYTDAMGEYNGSEGEFVYVDGSVDETEEGVYSYHTGRSSGRSYEWCQGQENGGENIFLQQVTEYGGASLGDLVWTHRLKEPVDFILPDGRTIYRKYIDYITTDISRSLPAGLMLP